MTAAENHLIQDGEEVVGDEEVAPLDQAQTPAERQGTWSVSDWRGKMILDSDGEHIGKLQDVYVDVETDEPQFGTVKEGVFHRHLTFVPLGAVEITPEYLRVTVTKAQVQTAPDIELRDDELSQDDESQLYHHFEMNYLPPNTESGRRLARR